MFIPLNRTQIIDSLQYCLVNFFWDGESDPLIDSAGKIHVAGFL